MNYIIHNNAEEISKQFYRLSRPDNNIGSMYPVFTHPTSGDTAFGYEDGEPILVSHNIVNANDLINAIGLTGGQANSFENKIQSTIVIPQGQEPASGYVLGRFPSSGIMNQVGEIKSKNWMESNGWFPTE